jgi:hypothetical protein
MSRDESRMLKDGVLYAAVGASDGCIGCALRVTDCRSNAVSCLKGSREDRRDIIWVPEVRASVPTVTQTTDRAAVVDKGYHWRLIDERTPRGTKLQLVRRDAGVALYGVLGSDNDFFTHWAPLPTFED